jgi:methyl-accepting chemotaxis protein
MISKSDGNGAPWWIKASKELGFPVVATGAVLAMLWYGMIQPAAQTAATNNEISKSLAKSTEKMATAVEGLNAAVGNLVINDKAAAEFFARTSQIHADQTDAIRTNGTAIRDMLIKMDDAHSQMSSAVEERKQQTEILTEIRDELRKKNN